MSVERRKVDPTRPVPRDIYWLPVEYRRVYNVLLLTYWGLCMDSLVVVSIYILSTSLCDQKPNISSESQDAICKGFRGIALRMPLCCFEPLHLHMLLRAASIDAFKSSISFEQLTLIPYEIVVCDFSGVFD